ncbi:protein FAR1-RELATED SEQUENCE 6-like [Arachis stenosperma]|uniref:protein FAR1-RELATED SEQUENCE 6-like n=1 Tax=Arachis stenosperma TaxID=217475 RepID=UPI0025ACCBDE|nr:protein FAR1-RELATED SEQUENCE 6-like [Arachis stenosperma]
MGGNALKGFVTDQCASMKRALEACMPTTVHRWCIWHIMKKIPSKLNGYKGHADIEQEMSHVVSNSHSKDSFDRNWNDFLLNFGLADNKWLSGSKQRENQTLQIFIRSYRMQPNPLLKLSFKMRTLMQSLRKSKHNSEERRIASPD